MKAVISHSPFLTAGAAYEICLTALYVYLGMWAWALTSFLIAVLFVDLLVTKFELHRARRALQTVEALNTR